MLSDENRDLHKQYGCINGIFHVFDRHCSITGRRMSSSSNRKRLLPGPGAEQGTESKLATGNGRDKNVEIVKDKPRVSIESPRNSSSSSSHPSILPLPNNVKIDGARPPPLISQSNHLDRPIPAPKQLTSSSSYSNHQPVDLRNAVKNSIHREHSGLSVKTAVKEEGRSHAMKHIDSPRPLQLSKSGYSRITDFDGSPRTLSKIPESPRNLMEDPLSGLARKDLPRFSLDGRETRDGCKSSTKFKDLPRWSLDSRESALRKSDSESRSNYLLRNDKISQIIGANKEPGSNKRPSNVIAKLMGLEAFPDSNSRSEGQICRPQPSLDQEFEISSIKKSNKTKPRRSLSRKAAETDPAFQSLRSDSSLMKPSSTSKIPIEPAPWREPNGGYYSPKTAHRSSSVSKEAKIAASVYGEMEKRISELDFKRTGKDLRALKQILEAMQKGRKGSEDENGEQTGLEPQRGGCSPSRNLSNQISRAPNWLRNKGNNVAHAKDPNSPKKSDSSVAITKQSSPLGNSKLSSLTDIKTDDASYLLKLQNRTIAHVREDSAVEVVLKDETRRKSTSKGPSQSHSLTNKKNINSALKAVQTSRAPQLLKEENYTAFERSSPVVSPRLQANQHGGHKQYPAAIPSAEAGRAIKSSSRQAIQSDMSTRKLRPKGTNHQGAKCKPSNNADIKSFSPIDDSASLQSDSNSSASQIENEVTSTEYPIDVVSKQQIYSKERNIAARLYEDKPPAELTVAMEQPSPISVLDATFCVEDSPSPVKKISITFEDFQTADSDEAESPLENLDLPSGIARSSHHDDFSKRKAERFIQSTRFPTLAPDAVSWDLNGSFHQNSNFDYNYIAKILSASGLFKNTGPLFTATQTHSPGQLINPDLFHVLEQTEQNTGLQNYKGKVATFKCNQKIHRRMLFDALNEIMVRKLTSEGPFMFHKWIKTGQELLRAICLEMDSLQANIECCLDDPNGSGNNLSAVMKGQPDDWADNRSEIPVVMLDIELLIFEDLITEVLNGRNLGLHDTPRKQHKLSAY